jgi:putative salt-induced outer membrane protein YdiY
MSNVTRVIGVLLLALGVAGGVGSVSAQEAPPPSPWSFEAELSIVNASGNQQSVTYGLATKLGYKLTKSVFGIEAGGLSQESTVKTLSASGDSANYTIDESKVTATTAEAYYARGRYDYNVSNKFFLLAGVDWMRNTFAGIDSRTLVGAGAGNTWRDDKKLRFKTTYSFTYTFQQDVVENPLFKTDFPGLRGAYEFWIKITPSTEFESRLTADFNLDNTDDIRVDFYNALPISVSSKIAFKPSLRLMWRNQPSLTQLPLVPGPGSVTVPLDKLDSFASVSLLVKI